MIFKLALLLSINLIALLFAVFIYIYIKAKQDRLPKWFSYLGLGAIGAVVLMKIVIVVMAICLICCRHRGGENKEKRMFMMMHEMRMHQRDGERECEGDERCSRGKMDCDMECEEACEGKGEMSCPKGKCERDTVVQKVIKK